MDRCGVAPEETLMIGDTTHDLELARNAGRECGGRDLWRTLVGGPCAHVAAGDAFLDRLNWPRGSGRTRGLRAERGGRTAILEACSRAAGIPIMAEEHWERGVIERLATEGLREMRRARQWGIAFKLLTLVLLFGDRVPRGWALLRKRAHLRRQVHGAGRHARRARRRRAGERRERYGRAAGGVQEQGHAGRRPAHQQSRGQSGPGRDDQRRDPPPARELSQHAALCGGRGGMRVGRLLCCRRHRQDLCRQSQSDRLDRGDHRRLRLRRRHGQARHRAPRARRRRKQGISSIRSRR